MLGPYGEIALEKIQSKRSELKGDPYIKMSHLISMHADRVESS